MTCPKCGRNEYVQYVFVLHVGVTGLVHKENPSDEHWLYLCPNNHVYTEDEKELES